MHELPQCFHELSTLLTLTLASVWLVAQWLRVGEPRERACTRCEQNPINPRLAPARSGRRSEQLRVLR